MSKERELLQQVREQNSRLRQLIDLTARLLARSRALLSQLGSSAGAPRDPDLR